MARSESRLTPLHLRSGRMTPDASLHEPGTVPLGPVKEPEEWRNASELTDAQVELVRECWRMVDSLKDELTIHKVTYIWDLEKALVAQDITAVVTAAQSYVDLLDCEAVYGKEPGTYYGAEGDVTRIRRHLGDIESAGQGVVLARSGTHEG